jgi:hypothetical protein
MGREEAESRLLALAQTASTNSHSTESEQTTAILCRMLFTPRAGADFQRPAYLGAPAILGDPPFSTSNANWPLEPIELVDGIPFAVEYGYTYEGFCDPHGAESYVRYCITNCDWSSISFTAKTEQEKEGALKKLISSSKWHQPLDSGEREYLRQQIQGN